MERFTIVLVNTDLPIRGKRFVPRSFSWRNGLVNDAFRLGPSVRRRGQAPPRSREEAICNLYKLTRSADEVAGLFRAVAADRPNVGAEVYPGYPGLVIAEGRVRQMTWGFPLSLKGRSGKPLKPKPVNNARADKLLAPGFWRSSFESRRCLIPLTAWAEAEGPKGKMTRTWYSLPNADLFAVAGIWRPTDEWGDAYSMVMVDGCEQMADVHDRMPVILRADDCDRWMDAPADEARELVRTYDGPLAVERTGQLWRG